MHSDETKTSKNILASNNLLCGQTTSSAKLMIQTDVKNNMHNPKRLIELNRNDRSPYSVTNRRIAKSRANVFLSNKTVLGDTELNTVPNGCSKDYLGLTNENRTAPNCRKFVRLPRQQEFNIHIDPLTTSINVMDILIRHLILLSEAFQHELQLIPLISEALYQFSETNESKQSEDELTKTLKKDLTVAYALIASEVRKRISLWKAEQQTSEVRASQYKQYQGFFTDLQNRIHLAVSWNSSLLLLKHSEVIRAVCDELGVARKVDLASTGILKLQLYAQQSAVGFPKLNIVEATTPLLEGYSRGALFPSSIESARQVQLYNAKIIASSKLQIAHQANKQLKECIISNTMKPTSFYGCSFTVQCAWQPSGTQTTPQSLRLPIVG